MKNSPELFLLIKSLTKNEKGYFKKFATINGKSSEGNYLRLFDCIDSMNDYDESIIRKKFSGEKFLTQLNVTKLYLQKMIIRSLRNFHSENDTDIERLNLLIEVQMLIKKQLYDSANRLVTNLIEKCAETESHLTLLYAMQLQYQICIRKGHYAEMQSNSLKKLNEEKALLKEYENLSEYRFLQAQALSITQIEGYTRNESRKKMQEFMKNPLLTEPAMAKSFMAKLHRNEILLKCYLKTGDAHAAYTTAKDMLQLFEDNPKIKNTSPYNYFVALNSLSNRCISIFKYDEAKKHIRTGESLLEKGEFKLSDSQRFEIAIQMAEKKMIACEGTRDFNEGIECEKKILELIHKKPVRAEFNITLKYFAAACYFGVARYNDALDRINAIIHDSKTTVRKDLMLAAYTLNIIIHFELGNQNILSRQIKMAENFAIKNKFPIPESKEYYNLMRMLLSNNADKASAAATTMLTKNQKFDFIDEDIIHWWLVKNKKRFNA